MKCPVCFSNVAEGASSCKQCGNPVRQSVKFCSNCGQNTEEHWQNCKYCGNPLIAQTAKEYNQNSQTEANNEAGKNFESSNTSYTHYQAYKQPTHSTWADKLNGQSIAETLNSAINLAGKELDKAFNTSTRTNQNKYTYTHTTTNVNQNSPHGSYTYTSTSTSTGGQNTNAGGTSHGGCTNNSTGYTPPPNQNTQGGNYYQPHEGTNSTGMFSFTSEGLGSTENNIIFSRHSRLMALILAGLFGVFGVHNFYMGYHGKGVIQLLLNCAFIFMGIGPLISFCWAIYDIFCLITHRINFTTRGEVLL